MTSRISDITYLIFRCLAALPQAVFSPSTISVWSFIILSFRTTTIWVLWFVYIDCHCFAMQCMWYACDTFLLLPLDCPAYLLIISQSSCFHCMRQQQQHTLHRPQSAQITTLISQEWKGLKHAIIVSNFPLMMHANYHRAVNGFH